MRRVPLPGSLVWLRQQRWRVDRVRADRRVVRLDVSHRSARLTVLTPFDRPRVLAGNRRFRRVRRQRGRVVLAHLLASAPPARLVHAVVDGHIDIWPHQIEPVLAVADGHRRLLIADDVGLGKTIQAGLIVAELLRRHPGARVLVVTPASLRRQWVDELRTRFRLDARTADEDLVRVAGQHARGNSPWLQPGIWIASIDYLKQAHVMAGLPVAPWDAVIVDEAHTASGRSDRYDACDEIGRRARRLVLLTATPHDGDHARFARLLRMGALPCVTDTLSVFRRTRDDVAIASQRAVRWMSIAPGPDMTRLLDTLHAFERAVLDAVRPDARDVAVLLLAVLRKRALSTVAALDRSLARRLEWLDSRASAERPDWLQPSFDFGDDDVTDDDRVWLSAEVGMPRARERAWLTRLRGLAAAARRWDPKLGRLRELLRRSSEPVVIFTEFRHSLDEIERLVTNIRPVAAIHGGQPDVVRQREIDRFLSGEASALIATDVGSIGLNLQARARWLINLELPWNPVRLEQRIGRLDRMGQTRRVHATLLVTRHAAEGAVLSALTRRTKTARDSMGSSTLASLMPASQLALASVLIDDAPLRVRSSPDTLIPLCAGFRRRARAHAVVAGRRRRLRSHWHGPAVDGRVIVTPAPATADDRSIVLVAVPIVDGTGDVVERRLVAVKVDAHIRGSRDIRRVAHALLPVIARTIQRRIDRLTRAMATVAMRRASNERAIARHLRDIAHPGEAQLGLFSHRAARAVDQARQRASAAMTDAHAHVAIENARQHLTAGALAIVWIGRRR